MGTTMNLPMPAGTTGDVYLRAFDEVIAPVVERFAPTWLLVSAGFDAHRDDPLTDLGLTAGDYSLLTQRAMQFVGRGRTRGDARRWVRPRRALVVHAPPSCRRWPASPTHPERPSAVAREATSSTMRPGCGRRAHCRERRAVASATCGSTGRRHDPGSLRARPGRAAAARRRVRRRRSPAVPRRWHGARPAARQRAARLRPRPHDRRPAAGDQGPRRRLGSTPSGPRASGSARSGPAATSPTGRRGRSRSRRSGRTPTSTTRASRT